MTTLPRQGKDHDFPTVARRTVEIAIDGWHAFGRLEQGTNPAAVALGKLGGAKSREAAG
jgi:hypothetical protein